MTIIQTLRPVFAMLHMPLVMTLFSALAAVISRILWAPSRSSFTFLPEKPPGVVTVCMACVPSTPGRCILVVQLVLLPYALEGLIAFLVSDHPKISSGISQGTHDTVHLDSAADLSICFMEIGISQGQGLTVCESFTSQAVSSKDKAFHWVENHNL